MENGKQGAFACVDSQKQYLQEGLTKREYFACQILAGMMLNCRHEEEHGHYAIQAIAYADALLVELETKPE